MYNLTVYVTNDCGACSLVLNWFKQNGVTVTEVINVDLDDNYGALNMLMDRGFMQFPVVSLNQFDIAFSGFELDKLEEIKKRIGG